MKNDNQENKDIESGGENQSKIPKSPIMKGIARPSRRVPNKKIPPRKFDSAYYQEIQEREMKRIKESNEWIANAPPTPANSAVELSSDFINYNYVNLGGVSMKAPFPSPAKVTKSKYRVDVTAEPQVIKCGISGDIIPPGEVNHTFVSSQGNQKMEYVSTKYLNMLNQCSSCENLFKENLVEDFCNSCIDSARDRYVKGYNTKVESHIPALFTKVDQKRVKFHDKTANEIYGDNHPNSFIYHSGDICANLFGVELEYEAQDSLGLAVLKVVKNIRGFAELKRDSTLRNGFEVVSAPADKHYHYRAWDDLFNSIESDNNLQCTPYSYDKDIGKGIGCGCHIHISKDSMIHHNSYVSGGKNLNIVAGLAIAKLQTFIYSKNNRKFVEIIAGRKSNMYNSFTQKKGIQMADGKFVSGAKSVIAVGSGRAGMDHRTAVNFNSSNGKTIEFRIFRSTKNKDELLKNIDFCDAICCFCRTGNASLSEMNDWIYFYEFVCKNRQDYPFLWKFFKEDESFLEILRNKENNIEEKIEDEPDEINTAEVMRGGLRGVAAEIDIIFNNAPRPAVQKKRMYPPESEPEYDEEYEDDGEVEPLPAEDQSAGLYKTLIEKLKAENEAVGVTINHKYPATDLSAGTQPAENKVEIRKIGNSDYWHSYSLDDPEF